MNNFLILRFLPKKCGMEFEGKYALFNERYWKYCFYVLAYSDY